MKVNGVNRTLQSLLRYVVDSLNSLSTHGLRLQSRANASGLQPLKSLSVLILRFFWGPPTYVWTWSSVQQGNDALSHYDIARGLEISQTVPMPVQKPSNGIYLL